MPTRFTHPVKGSSSIFFFFSFLASAALASAIPAAAAEYCSWFECIGLLPPTQQGNPATLLCCIRAEGGDDRQEEHSSCSCYTLVYETELMGARDPRAIHPCVLVQHQHPQK